MTKLQKYPVGLQHFESLIRDGYAYVDKTAIMYKLIDEGKYYFLSRPRRFGKSLMLSTIRALAQIEDKGYALPYQADPRRLYKTGAQISTEKRRIEAYRIV